VAEATGGADRARSAGALTCATTVGSAKRTRSGMRDGLPPATIEIADPRLKDPGADRDELLIADVGDSLTTVEEVATDLADGSMKNFPGAVGGLTP
jgi:hypothetical protein